MAVLVPPCITLDVAQLTSPWGPPLVLMGAALLCFCYPAPKEWTPARGDTCLVLSTVAGILAGEAILFQYNLLPKVGGHCCRQQISHILCGPVGSTCYLQRSWSCSEAARLSFRVSSRWLFWHLCTSVHLQHLHHGLLFCIHSRPSFNWHMEIPHMHSPLNISIAPTGVRYMEIIIGSLKGSHPSKRRAALWQLFRA